jgi:CO dehydrogenase/acetyl-CoA synthase gamma subunit (corrinoid Fe-S protein)
MPTTSFPLKRSPRRSRSPVWKKKLSTASWLPGHVAVLKGALEEESGWEVIVGPREASGITKFSKENFA